MTALPYPLPVRCRFSVRYPGSVPGKWRYRSIHVATPTGQAWEAYWPPAPGDLVTLWDNVPDINDQPPGGPVFLVTGRMWNHASHGSYDWPFGEPSSRTGPILDIIVEPAAGLYADEELSQEPGEEPA